MNAPRLLIVNPNTDARVTAWLSEEARRIARGRFEIVAINAESGLAAIETPAHVKAASEAVAAAVAADRLSSAAIVGAFGDPGLEQARKRDARPIVGLGESGMLAASAGGRRFAVVSLGAAMREAIADRAARLGLAQQLVEVRILPFAIGEFVLNRRTLIGAVASEVNEYAAANGADAVLLGGAPFAGAAAILAPRLGLLVLDGVEACVERLATSVANTVLRATAGAYRV